MPELISELIPEVMTELIPEPTHVPLSCYLVWVGITRSKHNFKGLFRGAGFNELERFQKEIGVPKKGLKKDRNPLNKPLKRIGVA